MDDSPALTIDDAFAEMAVLKAEVADLQSWRAEIESVLAVVEARKPRRSASVADRAILAEIIAAGAPLGTPFECGELTDDIKRAQRWGMALGRLADSGGAVDGYIVEWLGQPHRRAQWLLRPLERAD